MPLLDEIFGGARRIASSLGQAWRGGTLSPTQLTPDARTRDEVPREQDARLASFPLIDRYPVVLGSSITLGTVSQQLRLAQTGYRQTYVDLLRELIERDPHGYAVIQQRILTVAAGRLEIYPAECEEKDKEEAEEIAEECRRKVLGIPGLTQALAQLLWAVYFGPTGQEISWLVEGKDWTPARLHFIHSRRLAFPDPTSWNLHVWDLGLVQWAEKDAPTRGMFGIPVDAFPGKFIIHTPNLTGDYPTRDGLGRELAYWFTLKAMAARGASHYVERFGKPWPIAYYKTGKGNLERSANDKDLREANDAMKALGEGSLNGAVLADTITVELFGPGVGAKGGSRLAITQDAFIALINGEISKAVQGQTFTTETGKYGSRSTSDTGENNAMRIAVYDANGLAETVRRDLVSWIVRLNRGPEKMHLVPRVAIHVEDEPDPLQRMTVAAKAASMGMPVDADALADQLGLQLVPRDEELAEEQKKGGKGKVLKPRRLVPLALMKPADVAALEDPEELAKQQEQAAAAKAAIGQQLQQQGGGEEPGAGKPAGAPAAAKSKKPAAGKAPAAGKKQQTKKDAGAPGTEAPAKAAAET